MTEDALTASARTAVEQCLAVTPDETVLVVTDPERRPIGEAIRAASERVADATVYCEITADDRHGAEPSAPVAAAMRASDVVLAPTTRSLTHTDATQRACDAGARVATMPGVTEAIMAGAMTADYDDVAERCDALLAQVADADAIHLATDAGTDLSLAIGDRDWRADTGLCHDDGCLTNLPAGEVFVAPTSGDGTLVVDGAMAGMGRLDEPIEIAFEDGRAVDVDHDGLRERIDDAGDCGRHLAELGIGVNPAATLIGEVLQDEKVAGTIHVAVGDSSGFGGDVDCPLHLDGVVRAPTVTADGEPVALPD